ncbi:hypothetical protein BDV95DRAFT_600368 [Massariosphaeria phaeospora]|uniref:Uncharacterized protein n=1 Tax=Massariosphaeria phaeospora TaxID=100035 RepID=A0A7C8M107_9PLEO|nr:hypothetical protein BDV95DRAFT_600368 [Massariosphaeria phaeospora]
MASSSAYWNPQEDAFSSWLAQSMDFDRDLEGVGSENCLATNPGASTFTSTADHETRVVAGFCERSVHGDPPMDSFPNGDAPLEFDPAFLPPNDVFITQEDILRWFPPGSSMEDALMKGRYDSLIQDSAGFNQEDCSGMALHSADAAVGLQESFRMDATMSELDELLDEVLNQHPVQDASGSYCNSINNDGGRDMATIAPASPPIPTLARSTPPDEHPPIVYPCVAPLTLPPTLPAMWPSYPEWEAIYFGDLAPAPVPATPLPSSPFVVRIPQSSNRKPVVGRPAPALATLGMPTLPLPTSFYGPVM